MNNMESSRLSLTSESSGRSYLDNCSLSGCLSTKAGKVMAVLGALVALGIILHCSGVLSGVEHTLGEKVFTPMSNFFEKHSDLITHKILPGVLIGTGALCILTVLSKKGRQLFLKKVEEKGTELARKSLREGRAREEINRHKAEYEQEVQASMPRRYQEYQEQEQAKDAAAKQKVTADLIVGQLGPGLAKEKSELQQRLSQISAKERHIRSGNTGASVGQLYGVSNGKSDWSGFGAPEREKIRVILHNALGQQKSWTCYADELDTIRREASMQGGYVETLQERIMDQKMTAEFKRIDQTKEKK